MNRYARASAACAALLMALGACGSSVQSGFFDDPAPIRLPGSVDARSAHAVYQYGRSILEHQPGEAAMAFRWAASLDPTWAAPVFAWRTAHLMHNRSLYNRYYSGSRAALNDPRIIQLDSLYLRALQLNPFLDRSLEGVALRYVIREDYRASSRTSQIDESGLAYAINTYLQRAGPETRAWLAHADGRYRVAADLYRQALRGKKEREAAWLRVDLARALFHDGQREAARDELQLALTALHASDEDRLVRVYRSKAVLEHTLGLIHESLGDPAAARTHYANAMQEDLSYYQGHLRMAALSLAEQDTATARAGYQLALQIAPESPVVLWYAAQGLAELGDTEEAEAGYRKLLTAAPAFALPHHALAVLLDQRGEHREAMEGYGTFLELAGQDDRRRATVEARLELLRTAGAGGAP
jgi:tetratricopeptide (TPR) repeat protein